MWRATTETEKQKMKHAAWVIGLVVGVTGCSGTIGGDIRGHDGDAGGDSGDVKGNGKGGGKGNGKGGGPGTPAGGGHNVGGGYNAGGDDNYGGGFPVGGGHSAGGVENYGGGFPVGGGFPAGGGYNFGGGFPVGGGFPAGGGLNTPEYEPAPTCNSPVDAWVAFDSDAAEFNRDLYVARPDGSQPMRVTGDASIEKEPYFSPTGDRLSFTSDRGGSMQIYVLDLTTFVVTQVTHRSQGADQSSFSADGQLIAFHSGPSVYTIKPDGTDETLIATGIDEFNAYFTPRFIENGQLVFDRNNEIDAINLDKTNLRYVVSNTTVMMKSPTVSPMNNEVAYSTHCYTGEGFGVWTTPATLSSQVCSGRRVTPAHDPFDNTHASWGPSSMFAYERVDRATNIGRITLINRAPGSVPCSLTAATQDSRNPNWSKVGQQINFPTL
jgi:hypothetical protein